MKAHELDRAFDNAEDVSAYVDWSEARRANPGSRRVNVDFPPWTGRPACTASPGNRSSSSGSPNG